MNNDTPSTRAAIANNPKDATRSCVTHALISNLHPKESK